MLTLYVEENCGYSKKAMDALQALGLTAKLKYIEDVRILHELIERGGQDQVPYLIDDEKRVEMYDSDKIVEYLNKTYSKKEL